jgi:hypothetical protein
LMTGFVVPLYSFLSKRPASVSPPNALLKITKHQYLRKKKILKIQIEHTSMYLRCLLKA